MGLQMPAFAYYSAKGQRTTGDREGARDREDSKFNLGSRRILDRFFTLLRHPVLRDIAIEKQAAYNNQVDLHDVDWKARTVFETDVDGRPQLTQLIAAMAGRGTVVVPDFTHLRDGNAYCLPMIDTLCRSAIAPVAVTDLTEKIARLEAATRHPPDFLRRQRSFEQVVSDFFIAATASGVDNRDKLNNYLAHRPDRLRHNNQNHPGVPVG